MWTHGSVGVGHGLQILKKNKQTIEISKRSKDQLDRAMAEMLLYVRLLLYRCDRVCWLTNSLDE